MASKTKKQLKRKEKPYMRIEFKIGDKTGGFSLTKEVANEISPRVLYAFFQHAKKKLGEEKIKSYVYSV